MTSHFGGASPFLIAGPCVVESDDLNLRVGEALADLAGKQTGWTGDRGEFIGRNGITGIWSERDVVFPASLLKAGTNTLQLIVPAGPGTAGVIYDYLRLELDETGK